MAKLTFWTEASGSVLTTRNLAWMYTDPGCLHVQQKPNNLFSWYAILRTIFPDELTICSTKPWPDKSASERYAAMLGLGRSARLGRGVFPHLMGERKVVVWCCFWCQGCLTPEKLIQNDMSHIKGQEEQNGERWWVENGQNCIDMGNPRVAPITPHLDIEVRSTEGQFLFRWLLSRGQITC